MGYHNKANHNYAISMAPVFISDIFQIVNYSFEFMSLKDFEILAKLGDGAYSSVYKVRRL